MFLMHTNACACTHAAIGRNAALRLVHIDRSWQMSMLLHRTTGNSTCTPPTLGVRRVQLEVGAHGTDKQPLHPPVHVDDALPGRVSLTVQLQQVPTGEEGTPWGEGGALVSTYEHDVRLWSKS